MDEILMTSLWKKTALAAGSVILALAIVETALRIWPPKDFARLSGLDKLYRPDEILGFALRPNMRITTSSESGESEYEVRTNEQGLRSSPLEPATPRRHILGLGDSFLFGEGVAQEEGMMDRLQKYLDESFPGRYRTVNAGVPGYSTNQEILYYLTQGDPLFHPEAVVLFFYINDVVYYVKDINKARYHSGVPVPDMTALMPAARQTRMSLETWKFLQYMTKNIFHVSGIRRENTGGRHWRRTPFLLSLEPRLFNKEWTAGLEIRMNNTMRLLNTLAVFSRQRGTKVMIVYVPSSREAEEGPTRESCYSDFSFSPSSWDWDLPGRKMAEVARRLDIPFVDLTAAFRNHWAKTQQSLYIDRQGHFTSEGHELAARIIEPELAKLLSKTMLAKIAPRSKIADTASPVSPESRHPEKMGVAGGNARKIFLLEGDTAYERTFVFSKNDPISKIQFFVHPQSDSFVLAAADLGGARLFDQFVPPAANPHLWREVGVPMASADGGIRITIRPAAKNGRPVGITPLIDIRPQSSRRPPVILISLDALRPDHLPIHGYHRNTAPALDEFSRQAVVFEDVTAPSPWTLPSHISILTGVDVYTHHVGVDMDLIPAAMPTLPLILGRAGYVTGAVTGSEYLSHRYLPDFQVYSHNPDADLAGDWELNRPRLMKWLQANRGAAFFLFFHTSTINEPPARDEARYDAGIHRADRALDEIFSELKRMGIFDPALIIVTSGHGEELGDRKNRGHGFHQELLRVPLLIKFPGQRTRAARAGQMRVSEPAGLVDILPTVLDVLGLPAPDILDGQSLASFRPASETPALGAAERLIRNPAGRKRPGSQISRLFLIGAGKKDQTKDWAGAIRIGYDKMIVPDGIWKKKFERAGAELYRLDHDAKEEKNILTSGGTDNAQPSDLWRTLWETALYRMARYHYPPDHLFDAPEGWQREKLDVIKHLKQIDARLTPEDRSRQ